MATETQVLSELKMLKRTVSKLESEFSALKERFTDHLLTEEEKQMIDEAMQEKKEGKLLSSTEIFGK